MALFDTSGIEVCVTENNPKYANRIIRQLKAFKKSKGLDDSYDPYKAAYGSMPSHAASNPAIQHMYINGHFCYAFKFGINSIEIYKYLLKDTSVEKAHLPLNERLSLLDAEHPI